MASAAKIGLSLDEIIKQQRVKPGNKAGRGRGGGGVGRRPGLAIGSKRTSRVSALLNVDRNILKQAGINASKLQLVKKLINRARGIKTGPTGATRAGPVRRRGGASLAIGNRIRGRGGISRGRGGRGALRGRIAGPITTGTKKVRLSLRTQKGQLATGRGASAGGTAVRQRLGWQRAKRDEMLGQKRGLTIAQNKRVQVGAMRSDLVAAEQQTQWRQNLLRRGLSTSRGLSTTRGQGRGRVDFGPTRAFPTNRRQNQTGSDVFSRIGNFPAQRGRARIQRGNIRREIATAQPSTKSRINPNIRGSFSSNSTTLTLNERFGQRSVSQGGRNRGNRGGRQVMY